MNVLENDYFFRFLALNLGVLVRHHGFYMSHMVQSQKVPSLLCSSLKKKSYCKHTKDPNPEVEPFNLCLRS